MQPNKQQIKELNEILKITCLDRKMGGPFGALVLKDDNVVGIGYNRVLYDKDPTAHAEITAIRDACTKLGTHDLTGCEIYATGYPCPMCLSAIMWANIKTIYYTATVEEAEEVGFRDKFIYDFLKNNDNTMKIVKIDNNLIQELYNSYKKQGEIY